MKSLGSVFYLAPPFPASMGMAFLKAIFESGHTTACTAVSYWDLVSSMSKLPVKSSKIISAPVPSQGGV